MTQCCTVRVRVFNPHGVLRQDISALRSKTICTLQSGLADFSPQRATQFVKDLPEGCTCVYIYRRVGEGMGDRINWKAIIYKRQVTLKLRFNDKVVKGTSVP
jgi:hypothetical protein